MSRYFKAQTNISIYSALILSHIFLSLFVKIMFRFNKCMSIKNSLDAKISLANLKKSLVQWVRSSQIPLAKDLTQLCSTINYTFRVPLIIIVVLYWVLDYVLSKQFRFAKVRRRESIVNMLVSQSITNIVRLIFNCINQPEWKRHAMYLPIGVSLVDNCWYSDNFATAFSTN